LSEITAGEHARRPASGTRQKNEAKKRTSRRADERRRRRIRLMRIRFRLGSSCLVSNFIMKFVSFATDATGVASPAGRSGQRRKRRDAQGGATHTRVQHTHARGARANDSPARPHSAGPSEVTQLERVIISIWPPPFTGRVLAERERQQRPAGHNKKRPAGAKLGESRWRAPARPLFHFALYALKFPQAAGPLSSKLRPCGRPAAS
jgi:hypothetical protein